VGQFTLPFKLKEIFIQVGKCTILLQFAKPWKKLVETILIEFSSKYSIYPENSGILP